MEQSPAGPLQAQLFCNANLPPKPQQSTIPLSAAQQTTEGGEGGREGTQSPARTWATASKPDPKRNVCNPPRAPGQAVLRASPAPSRAAQTGRGYLVKTLLCVFKATSRVLQGHHREMGSKEMFACPAPCQQLLPKHRAPGALLPFTPFPSKSPSTRDESASGKTWLAGKRLSLSWLVPDTLMGCQKSLSAQLCMARRLPVPSHLTAIPGTQKGL